MIIKLKDLLKETDITIRNPHTHKTIKAQSALSSDDPNLVKRARKALGMDDKDKKDDSDENVKFRNKIFEKQKQAYNEMTSDGLPEGGDTQAVLESRKLAEET